MYYKRKYKKKRHFRRHKAKGPRTFVGRVKKVVNRMVETKAHIVNRDDTTVTDTPTVANNQIQCFTTISQGGAVSNRVGDRIHLKSLEWRYVVNGVNINAVFSAQFRMVLFLWKIPNNSVGGTTPIPDDIFGAAAPALVELTKYDSRGTYKILLDKTFALGAPNTGAAGNTPSIVHGYKRIKLDVPLQFSIGSTNSEKNSLWLMMWSDENVAQNGPVFRSQARITFTDA